MMDGCEIEEDRQRYVTRRRREEKENVEMENLKQKERKKRKEERKNPFSSIGTHYFSCVFYAENGSRSSDLPVKDT